MSTKIQIIKRLEIIKNLIELEDEEMIPDNLDGIAKVADFVSVKSQA